MKILSALGLLIGAVLIFLALSGQLDYHLYSASQQVVGGIRSASSPNSKISTVKPSLESNTSTNIAEPKISNDSLPISIGKRVALVIGNSKYKYGPLINPKNDADDITKALSESGFTVISLRDASLAEMRQAVRKFGDSLLQSDVGLVYYSGHGMEVKGRNYLIPVNADIHSEDEVPDQGLDVSFILEKMATANKKVNILMIDACRDNPHARSFRSSSRGLTSMDAPNGTLISFSTAPGKVAFDGTGRNSPYVKYFLEAIKTPNRPIEQVFKEVRRNVQIETKNVQTPWENTSLNGDFYFKVVNN
jgi:uncharacterized caspase-like protein